MSSALSLPFKFGPMPSVVCHCLCPENCCIRGQEGQLPHMCSVLEQVEALPTRCSGSTIMRCVSRGASVKGLKASTTRGPAEQCSLSDRPTQGPSIESYADYEINERNEAWKNYRWWRRWLTDCDVCNKRKRRETVSTGLVKADHSHLSQSARANWKEACIQSLIRRRSRSLLGTNRPSCSIKGHSLMYWSGRFETLTEEVRVRVCERSAGTHHDVHMNPICARSDNILHLQQRASPASSFEILSYQQTIGAFLIVAGSSRDLSKYQAGHVSAPAVQGLQSLRWEWKELRCIQIHWASVWGAITRNAAWMTLQAKQARQI